MSNNNNSTAAPLINFIYIVVVVICVTISTIASYGGLKDSLGIYSYMGAALIGMMLFVSDIAIAEARRGERPLLRPVAALLLVLVFSTASNFNYFYTRYLQADLSSRAYQSTVEKYRQNVESAKKRLRDDQKLKEDRDKRERLEKLLSNLLAQATDDNRKGVGSRSRAIIRDIQKIVDITDLAPPRLRAPEQEVIDWFNRFSELARKSLSSSLSAQGQKYSKLIDDMDTSYAGYANKIPAIQDTSVNSSGAVRTLIENMKREISEFESRVNGILSSPPDWKAPAAIDAEAGRVGDIVRTIESVFKDGGKVNVAIWSLVLSLFIDLVPIFYAVLLVVKSPGNDGQVGAEKGPGGLRRRILT